MDENAVRNEYCRRQREFALRAAIGAGQFRIVRQLLMEYLLLATTATIMGIVLAYGLLHLIIAWLPLHLFPPDVAIGINFPVLIFSAGLALVITVLFGLSQALQLAKPEINEILKSNGKKTSGDAGAHRMHRTLVGAQIALTFLLLTAAGTVIESFLHLLRAPLGYEPHNVISVGIHLHENTYTSWQARVRYFEDLRASVAALPDVESASVTPNSVPPDSGWRLTFETLGKPASSPKTEAYFDLADSEYFRTLQVPLLEGRIWNPAEVENGARLVLVNQTFVRRYSSNENVVGHSVRIPNLQGRPPETFSAPGADSWMQIIGVVADSINDGPTGRSSPCPAHSFRILVVWNNVVVVGKFFVADCANTRLLPNLAIQKFAHLGSGSEFPISARIMRFRDPLHTYSHGFGSVFLSYCFSTAAKQRSM